MPQINPSENQTTFPVTVGLLTDPPRLAFFCPSTGLHFYAVFDEQFFWTGSNPISLTFAPDAQLAPPGYTNLEAHVQTKPFSTIVPTISQDGPTAIMTRPFPTSSMSSAASFNVWMTGTDSSGGSGVLAWIDPIWPVGMPSSGGPDKLVANQTDYYFMRSLNQTIELYAQAQNSVNWLQTQYGAIVGQTAVVSPPLGSPVGSAFKLTVEVNLGRSIEGTIINGTVGTAFNTALSYEYNGVQQTLAIHVLAQPALLATS